MAADSAGLYIHIPFCASKCRYCDFYSVTELSKISDFIAALEKEMALAAAGNRLPIDTLYIGGGTPSMLSPGHLVHILKAARRYFDIHPAAEITAEANPDSLTAAWLAAARDSGVNRLNIGVQSFSENALAFLGRRHSAEQALSAIFEARKSDFDNLGLDLIFGLPGQRPKDLEKNLACALEFSPEHLSCYSLTYEPGTPLAEALQNNEFTPLSEEAAADCLEFVSGFLTENGFSHYEISNFARTDRYRSRHNTRYWLRRPYIGLGPAAHLFDGRTRAWNFKDLDQYLGNLAAGRLPRQSQETLTTRQHMIEAIYLGLRLAEGIDIPAFDAEFSADFKNQFAPALNRLEKDGLLSIEAGRCRLTSRGRLFHESVSADLIAHI